MNLNMLPSAFLQAEAISNHVIQVITQLLEAQATVIMAVSGGKSPIQLFEKLRTIDIAWDKVIITLVDERIVSPTHADSNENLVRTHLLQEKAKAAQFVGLVGWSQDAQASLATANATVKPIDLAILGMGEDGHIASIFPDCPEITTALDLSQPQQFIITTPISAKYQRISLTLHSLTKIPNLILSINGTTKLKVLQEAMLRDNPNYPISYLISQRPDMQIYWHE
jgi:6-phosphogluconolactonase